jgi:hypothetical protein
MIFTGFMGGQMEPSATSDAAQGILSRLGVPFFGNPKVLNTQGFHKGYVHIVQPLLRQDTVAL